MKCKYHPTQDAVARCSICNQGMCNECTISVPAIREKYGTLCNDCLESEIKAENKKNIKHVIINLVLYLLGILIMIMSISEGGASMLIIGVLLCGFFTAITGWKKSKSKRKKNSIVKRLIVTLLFAVLGVIVTPITIIRNLVAINKNKKLLKNNTRNA